VSTEPLYILALLAACVALAEWLGRLPVLRHLGAALLVIVLGAVLSNVGALPRYAEGAPIYDGIFRYVAPIAIFWLLLGVHLSELRKAGVAMLILFVLCALGTVAGVLSGLSVVGFDAFGERTFALGGMFVGTYTGGSANFNAIAVEYDVGQEGALYLAANAVDAAMTTVWMIACVLVPKLLGERARSDESAHATAAHDEAETAHHLDVSLLVALGGLAVFGSNRLSDWIEASYDYQVPSTLFLTTFALILAQVPAVRRLRGTRVLALTAIYVFLAVIGALCDVEALRSVGSVAVTLVAFVSIVLAVHGVIVFGGAKLMRMSPSMAAVASQAAVGGGSTAMALGKSLGRHDLVLPGILLGSLGTALGNYLGLFVAELLR
jgi:uncharacterized membrane protein